MKMRGVRYDSMDEIKHLPQKSNGFSIRYTQIFNFRNSLGLKHAEDWIFNLNIGNVMFLSKMDDDELNYPRDRFHELNKDAMLEKLVLMSTCFF